jgi:hypothetical protein
LVILLHEETHHTEGLKGRFVSSICLLVRGANSLPFFGPFTLPRSKKRVHLLGRRGARAANPRFARRLGDAMVGSLRLNGQGLLLVLAVGVSPVVVADVPTEYAALHSFVDAAGCLAYFETYFGWTAVLLAPGTLVSAARSAAIVRRAATSLYLHICGVVLARIRC